MFCSILREFGINATCNLMENEAEVCRTSFYDRLLRDPDLKVLVLWTPLARRLWSEKRDDTSVSFWELIDDVKRELINKPTTKKFAFAVFEQTGGAECVPQDLKLRAKSFVLPDCLKQMYFWLVEVEQFTPEGQRTFDTLSYDEHENGHDFIKHVRELRANYTEHPAPKFLPPAAESIRTSVDYSTTYDTDTDVHLQFNENQKSTFYADKMTTNEQPTYYASTESVDPLMEAGMLSTDVYISNCKSTAEYLASSRCSESSFDRESMEPQSENSFWLRDPQRDLDRQLLEAQEEQKLCESVTRVVSDGTEEEVMSCDQGSHESLIAEAFKF